MEENTTQQVSCNATSADKQISKVNTTDEPEESLVTGAGQNKHSTSNFFLKLPPEVLLMIFELLFASASPKLPECIHLYPSRAKDKSKRPKEDVFHRSRNMTPELSAVLAMLQVSHQFRVVVSEKYGVFNSTLLSQPLLLRPSVDFLDFRDMPHLNHYTNKATRHNKYEHRGVSVRRLSIGAHPANRSREYEKYGIIPYASRTVEKDLWKAFLVFPDLEQIVFYYGDEPAPNGETAELKDLRKKNAYKKDLHLKGFCARYFKSQLSALGSDQSKRQHNDPGFNARLPQIPRIEYMKESEFVKTHHRVRKDHMYPPGLNLFDSRHLLDNWDWRKPVCRVGNLAS